MPLQGCYHKRAKNHGTKPQRRCAVCGCTDTKPCAVPDPSGIAATTCFWVAWDLCSRCVGDDPQRAQTLFQAKM